MSKVASYTKFIETRENGSVVYWRTGKGSHRHASAYCANSKRDIMTGDVFQINENEAADWAACADCCTDADIAASALAVQVKTNAMCKNSGVTNSRRIYSACRDCGKEGKVNRSTGNIRAHKPQA